MSDDHIVVFASRGCGPCAELVDYIDQRDIKCEVLYIEEDISSDAVQRIYPDVTGWPHVLVNNRRVGNLIYYLESGL